jgi:hypothetical protein
MKKLLYTLVLLIILISYGESQGLTSFGYDKALTLAKLNEYVKFVGSDSEGFYVIRIDEKDDLHLEFFNANSLIRENSNQLILPSIGGIKSDYVAMFYLRGTLILLTEVLNNTTKEKTLYMQEVNKSGQVIGEPQIIGKLTNQNISQKFNVSLTPNQQNIFVYYNIPFQTYNEEPFFFKVYNSDMKEIYNYRLKLPMKDKSFEIDQTIISNNGNIYMVARIAPDARQMKRMKNIVYDYKLLIFDEKSGNIKDIDIKGKKFILVDAIIGVDEEENVDIFGFMVRKGKDTYEGIFHQKYNTKTDSFVLGDAKMADYVFSKTEIPEFRADRLTKIYDEMYNYKLLNVFYLSNGGSVMIAEHRNYWVDSIIVPGSKEVIYNDYFRFNDVLVAYCSPENNMEWMTRIPKAQYSYNDLGKYSSIAAFPVGEKVYLFYNEHPKNIELLQQQNLTGDLYKEIVAPGRKGTAVAVSIFSDGKVSAAPLFSGKNKNFKIIPELIKEFNGRILIYAENKNKVNFAVFTGR